MSSTPTALITGAGRGLGRALAVTLAGRGWRLLLTARSDTELRGTAASLGASADVAVRPGDVADPNHRQALVSHVHDWGGLDLLVNNASHLGPSPLPPLRDLAPEDLAEVMSVNVLAPHALTRGLLPLLVAGQGIVLDISSDAAVEHYPGWGGYGASKAALDHLALTLAGEEPGIRVYALDPGDMRTAMHQDAFPGEDISDRPLPEEVAVPALLELLRSRPESGRYRAADLLAAVSATTGVRS